MLHESSSYEWPGWPIAENSFGKEFDLDARKRMFQGSRALLPLMEKYKDGFGQRLLEVGPFFIPLITKESFPDKDIVYWENDPHVIKWLCEFGGVEIEELDLNRLELSKQAEPEFNAVIASEVLNYIDYRTFIAYIHKRIHPEGLLFINNVIEYGLPTLFSEKRPRSIGDIKHSLLESGFSIIEEQLIPSQNPEAQKEPRLVLVATK